VRGFGPQRIFIRSSPRKRGPRLDSRLRGNERCLTQHKSFSQCIPHPSRAQNFEIFSPVTGRARNLPSLRLHLTAKEGSRTPIDASSNRPHRDGCGSASSGMRSPIGVPPRPRCSERTPQLSSSDALPGTDCAGAGVTRPLPPQCSELFADRSSCRPGVVAKAARERSVSLRARAPLPLRFREYLRERRPSPSEMSRRYSNAPSMSKDSFGARICAGKSRCYAPSAVARRKSCRPVTVEKIRGKPPSWPGRARR
jgi:hypothetical protein